MIFWQSARTAKQARPQVSLPTARAHGQVLDIVVDVHERYAYGFSHQQATTRKSPLRAGDYAITDGDEVIAAVERKSVEDLSSTLLSGRMTYLMADLASLPRAAVVVEAGYSRIFKLQHASGAAVAESLAETQARFPSVPIVFCDNRSLAQEWVYRWFGACQREHDCDRHREVEDTFAPGGPLPDPGPRPLADHPRARRERSVPGPAARDWPSPGARPGVGGRTPRVGGQRDAE